MNWIPFEQVQLQKDWEQTCLQRMCPTLFAFPTIFKQQANGMQIVVMSRHMFEKFMMDKEITPDNVEKLKDVFIISIQNDAGDAHIPYFPENKKNVLVQYFSDVEEDIEVQMIGSVEKVTAKAMSSEQAKEMYQYIMDNKVRDKKICLIYCTADVSRSGAVGVFVAECMGVNYLDFKRANPSIQPNIHMLKLLREAHLNHMAGLPQKEFKVELLNPQTPQQEVALFNDRHPDQHTTYEEVKWVDFWLETNQYFSIVRYGDLPVLREVHPDFTELLATARLNLDQDEFNNVPTFGITHEYKGPTLGRWLVERNMLQFFNN